MSRSYKKVPYCGDKKGKDKKRIANHAVRNYLKDLDKTLSRGSFKKIFCSYDICDYGWLQSWEEYWEDLTKSYQQHPEWYKQPPNKKKEYRFWYKHHKMK